MDAPSSESDPISQAAAPPAAEAAFEERLAAKILLRLIPFIVFLYVLNYIDRANVSFAKLTMNRDLGLSDAVYGAGAGIFFVSYFIFEVPSNLIMARVGARLWLARIMISWGLIAAAMMFVSGKWSFYTLRFLLGAAEAGFAPGVLLYLTYWLPARHQARAVSWFLTSIALAFIIGGPLSGLLLELEGTPLFGRPLHGWQWLFLVEGIPSILAGITILFFFPDRPDEARWLSAEEKAWLHARLAEEQRHLQNTGHTSLKEGLTNRRVLLLCAIYFALMFGFQGMNFWLPTIIKQAFQVKSNFHLGLMTAVIYLAAGAAMVLVGRHSDKTGERRGHAAVCALIGMMGFLLALPAQAPPLLYASLALASIGIWGMLGPFWALPPAFLSGTAAAAGIALINSLGNLGGFVTNTAFGTLKDHAQAWFGPGVADTKPGLAACAVAMGLAALMTLSLRRREGTLAK